MSLRGFIADIESKNFLDEIRALIAMNPAHVIRNELMALNANVQKLIDDVAKNSDLVKSNNARTSVLQDQITDLKTQISALQAGQVLTQEDLDGINKATAQLEETNQALDTAVPAGTTADPNPAPAPLGPQGSLTSGTQPVTSDAAGNPIAPDAPGQPGVAPVTTP